MNDEIKKKLAERFGLLDTELVFLAGGREDSDGIVFTTMKDGKKMVFKISQASDEEHVKNILEFAHYLGNHGIFVRSPVKNSNGNIYEAARDGDTLFIATLMEFIEGIAPDVNELLKNTKLVYEWGKLTGRMHRAAKEYPIWKNVCEGDERYGFHANITWHLDRINFTLLG